ncbi:MAG TPA: hypothetical protein VF069_02390 [Streptosporangiaceae bacterium]
MRWLRRPRSLRGARHLPRHAGRRLPSRITLRWLAVRLGGLIRLALPVWWVCHGRS